MKAHKSLWLVVLSVVTTTVVIVSAMSLGPAMIRATSPSIAQAEDLPPEAYAAGIQATGTLHTLSVPPSAFTPWNSAVSYENHSTYLRLVGNAGAFTAPVYLPQGAKVTKLVVYCLDNDAAAGCQVVLGRTAVNSAVPEWLARVNSSDSATVQKLMDNTIVHPTINNGSYSYYLDFSVSGTSFLLYSIKIVYYY
ncbi:MAG: hypothetical protein M1319_01420 [Chloroflexi bacterium]|nr:hypothetical protein [Chloroflexota bacterium]